MRSRYTLWILVGIAVSCWFLVGAASRHPASYYTLLRWTVMLTASAMAYRVASLDRIRTVWPVYAIIALLFNSIVPISLQRKLWKPIDRVVALALIAGGIAFVIADRTGAKRNDVFS